MNKTPETPEWSGGYGQGAAKSTPTAEVCTECGAVVAYDFRHVHLDWHDRHDDSGTKLKEALVRTNDRINRILDGTVRLR